MTLEINATKAIMTILICLHFGMKPLIQLFQLMGHNSLNCNEYCHICTLFQFALIKMIS